MAKKEKAEKPEVVEAETTELVQVSGVGADLWKDATNVFVPALRKDMPLAERKVAIRDTLRTAVAVDDRLNLVAGELLYEVSKNGYWKEWDFTDDDGETRKYASFEEYTENEMNMKRRKAFYLISIYEKFVVDLDLPPEVLKDLEWSKAKELTGIITKDSAADLLDKAKGMSVRKVKEFVAAEKARAKGGEGDGTTAVTEGADGKEPEVATKVTLKLYPEQLENYKTACEAAQKMGAGDKPGAQIDLICSSFLASSLGMGLEGGLMTMEAMVKSIERSFGVELELKSVDSDRYKDLDTEKEKAPV